MHKVTEVLAGFVYSFGTDATLYTITNNRIRILIRIHLSVYVFQYAHEYEYSYINRLLVH